MTTNKCINRYRLTSLLLIVLFSHTGAAVAGFLGFGDSRPMNDSCMKEVQALEQQKDKLPSIISDKDIDDTSKCISTDISAMLECAKKRANAVVTSAPQDYLEKLRQQNKNRQQMIDSINADASRQSRYARGISANVIRLRQCRNESIASIKSGFQSGQLSKKDAKTELKQVKKHVVEDEKLIAEITGQSAKNTSLMVEASEDLGTYTPTPEPSNRSSSSRGFKCAQSAGNVRSGPGTNHSVVGKIQAGDCWPLLGEEMGGKWLQIDFNGQAAYVYHSLLIGSGTTSTSRSTKNRPAKSPARPTSAVAEADTSQKELENESQRYSELLKEIDEAQDFVLADG